MKQSPHASFKTLAFEVEKIALLYFSSKKQIRDNQIYSFSSGNQDTSNPFYLLISKVEHAFEELDNVEKSLLIMIFSTNAIPFGGKLFIQNALIIDIKEKQ